MKKFVAAVFILFVCSSVLFSADLKTYQASYDKQMSDIVLEHGATISRLNASYSKSMNNLSERATGAGNLDMMQAVMAEIKRFEAEKTVHEEASQVNAEIKKIQQAYIRNFKSMELAKAKKVLSLSSKYDSALGKLQISLAKQKKIDEAVSVKNERESLAKSKDVGDAKAQLTINNSGSSDKPKPVKTKMFPKMANAIKASSLSNGLQLKYTFDSDRGNKVADSSGKKNNGVSGGDPAKSQGIKGSALSFDGIKDLVVVQSKKSPGVSGVHESDYSLSLWFKPSSRPKVGEGIGFSCILVKAGWPVGLVYDTAGTYGMWVWQSTDMNKTADDPEGKSLFSVKSQPMDEWERWVHLTATVDSNNKKIKMYIDGVLDAEDIWPYKWKIARNGEPWRIGMSKPGSGKYTAQAHGAVDEVRIYDRILSDDEVKSLYDMFQPAPAN